MKSKTRHIIRLIFLGLMIVFISSCSSSRPGSNKMKKKRSKKCNTCPTFSQNTNTKDIYINFKS
ncbi:MAG: hypothetical protein PHO12_08570 [Bacteroidales bacterium]|nr:hypothetical protein [Bacteroidales bacterium]MDD4684873.1 hypothetical protein [Bacteroidales bacterium]